MRVLELPVRHRDGHVCQAEMTITNLLDNPSVGGLVLNTRDIERAEDARGPARPRGVPRLADLAREPRAVQGPGRARPQRPKPRERRRGGPVPRPRRLQGGQRQPRPRRRATSLLTQVAERLQACVWARRHGRPVRRRRVRRSARGTRATTRRSSVAGAHHRGAARAVRRRGPASSTSGPASASPDRDRGRRGGRPAAAQRRPGDVPGQGGRRGQLRALRPGHARRARRAAPARAPTCAGRSRPTSCSLHYQPTFVARRPARSSASRPWSAGTTRPRGWSALAVHPARRGQRPRSGRSAPGCCTRPAARPWPWQRTARRAIRRLTTSASTSPAGSSSTPSWSTTSPRP